MDPEPRSASKAAFAAWGKEVRDAARVVAARVVRGLQQTRVGTRASDVAYALDRKVLALSI